MATVREVGFDGKRTGKVFGTNAPKGQFRVITLDAKTGATSVFADFDELLTAKMEADDKADGAMVLATVYDDQGIQQAQFGQKWNK